ncbi:hypothetical protein JCM21900_002904 [Sporobolomyces salmonicolor]
MTRYRNPHLQAAPTSISPSNPKPLPTTSQTDVAKRYDDLRKLVIGYVAERLSNVEKRQAFKNVMRQVERYGISVGPVLGKLFQAQSAKVGAKGRGNYLGGRI